MKRWLAIPLMLLLLPALAHAQNLSLQVNSPFAARIGQNANLTATANLLDPAGTTSNTLACPGTYYVDRTQSQLSAAINQSTVVVNQPPEAQNGDFDLVFCTSLSGTAMTGPAGWTQLTPNATDAQGDITSAWYRQTVFGDPPSWTWTGGNWPKCAMRSYRGFTGIDASVTIPATGLTNNATSTITLTPLAATANPCEEFVTYVSQHGGPAQLTSLGGLVETTADNAGLSTFEGNLILPAQATVPTTGLGVLSTDALDQWTGYALTLHR